MAKLPGAFTIVEFSLPGGTARAVLRRPTVEEQNTYLADRLRVPEKAVDSDIIVHINSCRARFFDLLLDRFEDLEDAEGQPITKERTGEVPREWKAEAIALRFDVVPVSIKN